MTFRWQARARRAVALGLGVTALMAGAATGLGAHLGGTGTHPSTTVAVGTGGCQEFMCGTNHNQVLVDA